MVRPDPRAKPAESAIIESSLTMEDNHLAMIVLGQYDQNVAKLERRLNIVVTTNGNRVSLKGDEASVIKARRILERMYDLARQGQGMSLADVDGAIAEDAQQSLSFREDANVGAAQKFNQIVTRKRGIVRARNAMQNSYLSLLQKNELVFAEGPAGTGKTWLAVGFAVSMLEQGRVERLILSRPAVEAGERLGFLPGDMREKVDPYLRPVYDALHDFMDARSVERGLQTGMIEVAPLAFMRGRTLTQACVLLDEAQNATSMQMKMFLTRLGEGSVMIATGDASQTDLPNNQVSGLSEAISILSGVEGIGHVKFSGADVVRHELVRKIVDAYERRAAGQTVESPRR